MLLGFGKIGRQLARLIAQRNGTPPALRALAVVDSTGFVFDPKGLSRRRLSEVAAAKGRGEALSALPGGRAGDAQVALTLVGRHALSRPVLVDCTAAETAPLLASALASGMDLVLANKRPLAGPRPVAEALWADAKQRGRRILHETTVGAGLPVFDTYYKLYESGDRVVRIQGSTSGTLGFLLTEVGSGRPFSESLRAAMVKGYTEPDPREDLSGQDVARKALILGRLLGFRGELQDVDIEPLVPPEAVPSPAARVPRASRRAGRVVGAARGSGARAGPCPALPGHGHAAQGVGAPRRRGCQRQLRRPQRHRQPDRLHHAPLRPPQPARHQGPGRGPGRDRGRRAQRCPEAGGVVISQGGHSHIIAVGVRDPP